MTDSIGRIVHYGRQHGLAACFSRLLTACKRGLRGGRLIVFSCELSGIAKLRNVGAAQQVERKQGEVQLSPRDWKQLERMWYPKALRQRFAERFARGASLWLFRVDAEIAGCGWTLRGQTIEPYFFPFIGNDVHLFDFFVFPEYRGRGINVALVGEILAALAAEQQGRAFIEAAEWNAPQLRSLRKMPFKRLGGARKICRFGRTFVLWDQED